MPYGHDPLTKVLPRPVLLVLIGVVLVLVALLVPVVAGGVLWLLPRFIW